MSAHPNASASSSAISSAITPETSAISMASIRTTCPYCGVGCGVLATPDGKGGLAIAGDPSHPANLGRLCSKGSALGETVGLENRLLHPMLRTASGAYERASWGTALDHVAEGMAHIQARHGADALAFYLSGQLLTEDYYVANKLMKGWIGSANVDTNSRLCMASSVAGHRRAFGADTVPGLYADLDEADLIVLVGSNAAWCHPVLFQRMLANKARNGAKIIVIDPRRTATAEDADLFLGVAPGMDSILFAGLLVHLADQGALDVAYIARHTQGFDETLAAAKATAPNIAAVAALTRLQAEDVAQFFDLWTRHASVVTAWSQGVNQSAQGTDKVGSIINCHLATGRIGKPGAGPFSLTGQPNAMGGREVGGLANMLAAHMGFAPADVARVRRFWGAPRMATREGLKAVPMLEAVAEKRVKGLWVMATNPAVSLPRADAVRHALGGLELFVVSEVVLSNDTLKAGAHVLLPAAAWGEKDGTVTNSERRISRQRGVLPLPGEARPDWWIICEVAKRLGFEEGFGFQNAADIFREHAALSGFDNHGERDFDIGAMADISDADFDTLKPVLWPQSKRGIGANKDTGAENRNGKADMCDLSQKVPAQISRFFADGGYFHPDKKARFILPASPALADQARGERPFLLNTGRIRDQWHTMTRTGLSPRLSQHRMVPFVDMSPKDAARHGLAEGSLVRLVSDYGSAVLSVQLDEGQHPGMLFAPIHWTAETSSDGRIGAVVQPMADPFSGQPEMKSTPVKLEPVPAETAGFIVSRTPIAGPDGWWWSRVTIEGGHGLLMQMPGPVQNIAELARTLNHGMAELSCAPSCAEYTDIEAGVYRAARTSGGRLDLAIFLGPAAQAPVWDAVKALIAKETLGEAERRMVLSGHSVDGMAYAGPTICACFGVGLNAITAAISSGEALSIEALGQHLKAGTNCGSCIPEMKKILARTAAVEAALVTTA